jgi:hypothetical protein
MGKLIVSIAMSFLVSISLAGCWWDPSPKATTQAAKDALNTLEHDVHGSDTEHLAPDIDHLHSMPAGDFSSGDLNLRNTLIRQAAIKSLDNWANVWVLSRIMTVAKQAGQAANNHIVYAPDAFKPALTDVTEDAIRGQICKDILDLVAPDPNPSATDSPDDTAWQGDIVQDATAVLAKTFGFSTADYLVEWDSWYSDVTDAAQQAATSIADEPVPDIQFLSNPAGQRATAIYVRYCYAPPTTD